jgi:hypothetical protein
MAEVKPVAEVKRQLSMVLDLNKCLGCQTCTIGCKRLWTREEGMEYMWWNSVNTQPGRGTPRDWESAGGGFSNGMPRPGKLPTRRDFGEAWEFNHEEVFFGGNRTGVRTGTRTRARGSTRTRTTFTCRGSAITARIRRVWSPVHARRSRSGRRTGSF